MKNLSLFFLFFLFAGFTVYSQTTPTLTSFTPTNAASGQTVTITGTNFTGATAVRFGGVNAISFTVVNATTITAIVSAGASGSISITTPNGTASLSGFTFDICLQIIVPSNITQIIPAGQTGKVITYTTPVGTNTCANSQSYSYTGSGQTYTVPAGINSVNFNLGGGAGGSGIYPMYNPNIGIYYDIPGGNGGIITGKLAVTPGQTLNIFVASSGVSAHFGTGSGYNGGGDFGSINSSIYAFGGGGGGATDIRIGGVTLTDRVVVAGGGGGAGGSGANTYSSRGGAGGGLTGATGWNNNTQNDQGGGGGTQVAGGTAYTNIGVTAGALGIGGNGGSHDANGGAGGGGGGGYYGGGGGYWAGGGGGSSYPDVGTHNGLVVLTSTQGTNTGSGYATISYNRGGTPVTTLTTGFASGATFPVGQTTVTYTVSDEYGNSVSNSFIVNLIPAPSIASFTPTSATTSSTVTITGTDFIGASAVSFGGTAVSSFTVVNNTTITAIIASGTTGNVSVTTPGGTATLAGFTYTVKPTVTTSIISAFDANSASSGGNVIADGGENITDRGICYSTAINPAIADSKTSDGTGTGIFTSSLSGLSANTFYYTRAYATNTNGTSYGGNVNFRTLANVPDAPTINNATATSLDVTINVNANPNPTQFAIYETSTGKYVQANGLLGTTTVWQTVSNWGTKTVTGLITGAIYTFKVKARNSDSTETVYGATASGSTCSNPADGGIIASDQSICTGSIPVDLSNNTLPSNYAGGTLEYKWQISTTSSSSGFSDISSSNSTILGLGTLTQTTWYKRLAIVSCKSDWIGAAQSNTVMITVNPNPTPFIIGYPNDNYSVAIGSTNQYSTSLVTGHLYSWSAFGTTSNCHPSSGECISVHFVNPCCVYGEWNIIVTETDSATGCSKTATKHILIH